MEFWPRFRLAVVISIVYTILAVLYSFVGLLNPQPPISIIQYATFTEIGGHLLFGFIVGIFSFDLIIALKAAAFAVLVDAGKILSEFGIPIQASVNHSITFMILSALILGYIFRSKIKFEKLAAITVAAFLSHIAYDIIDSGPTAIPLLSPFSFTGFILPPWAVIPIEILGILIVVWAFKENALSFIRKIKI